MWPDSNKINNLIMSDIYKTLKQNDISIEQFIEYYNKKEGKI